MNRILRHLLLLLFSVWLFSCTGQTPPPSKAQRAIQHFASDTELKHASIGFLARDLSSGKTIAQHQAEKSLAPASTLKLLTTATALEILGPDFQFSTQIAHNGKVLPSGQLNGNLYLIGGGDPTLASKYFPLQKDILSHWRKKMQEYPITSIQGKLAIVENCYDQELPRTWIWEDIANYYGAMIHSISYRDNTYTLFFESGPAGTPTKIHKIDPPLNEIEFKNQVISSSVNRDQAYIFGGPESSSRIIKGSIPQKRKNFKVKGALPYPGKILRNDFQSELEQSGIPIRGKSLEKDIVSSPLTVLWEHRSPKLSDIVYQTNQKSINLFAEHLLCQIGVQVYQKGNLSHGLQAMKEFWKGNKMDIQGIQLFDGSGLSRFNAINASFLTKVLVYMTHSPNSSAFRNSLPIAGKSGTLKNFARGTVLENKLQAKTGSMQGVRCYSGYLPNSKGKLIAFTLIINNYNCSPSALSEKVKQLLIKIYYS
ncbi:MAG: D-alanyl-D-alanine carboxypeptidase/D-alanyl-D-alanine-endopeptidase [Marinifilaceae bacterium]